MDRRKENKEIHKTAPARTLTRLSAVLILLALFGCAGGVDYKSLNGYLAGDCPAAANYVSKKQGEYGPNRRLLYLLDAGTVSMMCGDYEKSNQFFHDADDLAEQLWTKSISKETASFLVNDYTIPYAGEDFEKALINLFSAIDYAIMGKYEDAQVECRRLDSNLSLYNQKYDKKNVYKEDAFGRYLSGMIYETSGSIDDAFIDYYKAYKAFLDYRSQYGTPVPSILLEDLARVARAAHRMDQVRPEVPEIGQVRAPKQSDLKRSGKIVFIHFDGISPVKKDEKIHIPTQRGPITIAFPKYAVEQPRCRDSSLIAGSGSASKELRAELVEDINKIAVKNLNDRKGRVVAKAIGRAAAKQVAIDAAANQMRNKVDRDVTRFLLNIVNTAVEKADTRSWRTLPGEIYLTRMFVPEGRYDLYAETCGEKRPLKTVDIRAGETRFILLRTY